MKSIRVIPLVLFLAGAFASCRDKPRNEAIATDKGKNTEKKFDPQAAEMDARFVMSQVTAHVAAVEWTMPQLRENEKRELRDAAFRIHREHQRLLEKWKKYAEGRNILVADSASASLRATISKYLQIPDSASARFWVSKMLEQEQHILSRLEDYMNEAGDPALKVLVTDEMPVIRRNRDELMMLKNKQ